MTRFSRERRLDRIMESGLSLEGVQVRRLHPAAFIPAPTQGALALQIRDGDEALEAMLVSTVVMR